MNARMSARRTVAQNSTSAPVSSALISSDFNIQPQAETISSPGSETTASLGHNLSNISLFAPGTLSSGLPIQPKLTIGQQGDVYEPEADRAAKVIQRVFYMDASGVAHDESEKASDPELNKDVQFGKFTKSGSLYKDPDETSPRIGKLEKGQSYKPAGQPMTVGNRDWLKIQARIPKTGGEIKAGWVKEDHTIDTLALDFKDVANQPLLPQGEQPKPEHVQQGMIGDCYLMAALISVAKQQPQKIINMFQPSIYTQGNENVAVRFYKTDYTDNNKKKTFTENWVTIPKSIVVTKNKYKTTTGNVYEAGSAAYAKGNVLWPALVEKAYAAWPYRLPSLKSQSPSYDKIIGGHGYMALEHLTGEGHTGQNLSEFEDNVNTGERGSGKYGPKLEKLFHAIEDALLNAESITLGTPRNWSGIPDMEKASTGQTGHSGGEEISNGLLAKHEYGVLGTRCDGDVYYVRIRNPWGHYGRKYTKKLFSSALNIKVLEGEEGGEFDLELSDLPRHFVDIGLKDSTLSNLKSCL
jgi:Calpain family cysteine protease